MIQRLITSAREVLNEVNGQTDLMWSKVKQMEVEVYRVNDILADTTGDLKDVLKEVFSTLNKVKDDILDGWEWLQEFLPNKVITYIEKSADDGQDLLKELYEETKKDVEEKTDKHVEEVSKIVEGFMDRLISIKDNTVEIATQGVPLSEKEIEAR